MTTTNDLSIEDVPLNGFHRLLSIRSGGGWLMDGYILSIIGVALVQLSAELNLDDFWQGMVAASALIGIFVGGFLGGCLTGQLGRQKLYFFGPIIFILCSLGAYWTESGLSLFIYRFLIGIGVGFEYPVAGALLVEFLPRKHRGPRLAAMTILWFVGAALAYIVGNLILMRYGDDAWRWVIASPVAIGAFLAIIRLGTPESPRWLVSKGRMAEAERVIRKVYGPSFSLRNLPESPPDTQGSLSSLLHSGYGARMLFVAVFWTCSVIPVFAVYAFAPKVLQALNLTGNWAAYGSVAITMLFAVGCVIATRLIDVIGRRSLVIHSFLWSGLALLGLGFFSDGAEWLVLALFGAYAVFIGGAQVLQLVYPNEIFPTGIRSVAVGTGASLSRIGAAVGTWLVPVSLQTIGIGNTMYAAAGVTLLGLLVSLALAPETRSLSLQEAASLDH
ncbi:MULTISPECIES: MFS transporter [unclassified Brenneria]|uniref:MFS transporter n=1 Tax=unclassified Brenneria TaxID=2634434 RepID=UPI0029C4C9A2|nr:MULTISPECIES: MFS transporter [unclassified Brenneria]MDX5627188.1 MFS transporter [Brenneria sp. L3-3Z]MDX5694657.1 MFS transporter [Brenneria sp. L4-2C]